MSTFWHPDPEPPGGVLGTPLTAGDAIEVTGLGDPVRSFISLRALTPAEEAEFRRDWENLDCWTAAGVLGPPVIAGMIAPGVITTGETWHWPASYGTHRGQCEGCRTDDDVDIWGRCFWCWELAALRARNLPGPPLAWWWYLVPSVLGVALGLIAVWAVLYVIFYRR